LKQEQKEPINSIKQKTRRKTRTGKLGNGGGDPERLMKNAHAHKNEKEETGPNESPSKNERS